MNPTSNRQWSRGVWLLGLAVATFAMVGAGIVLLTEAEDEPLFVQTPTRTHIGAFQANSTFIGNGNAQITLEPVAPPQGLPEDLTATPLTQIPPELAPAYQAAVGPDSARITLVEYGTYGCHVCRHVFEIGLIAKLLAQYPQEIRYVFVHWPVIHPNDMLATEAVLCAQEQSNEAFWAFHNSLFELTYPEYDSFDHPAPFIAVAYQLGLDPDAFRACLGSGLYRSHAFELQERGLELGLPGTPTFFVNGQLVHKRDLEDTILRIMAETRSRAEGAER
ncbi:MAG: thioredoxin domain-containing protein [Chloroflexi bacterium]|nr:thioredoxin domain-containing protein [Chloroflexota bacterium]